MQRGLDGLQDRSRLISWIYQIARHAIIDHYRAPGQSAERCRSGLAADLEPYANVAHWQAMSEDLGQLRAELAGCLRPMIERLSEEYRQAVTLVDLEGLGSAGGRRATRALTLRDEIPCATGTSSIEGNVGSLLCDRTRSATWNDRLRGARSAGQLLPRSTRMLKNSASDIGKLRLRIRLK